MLRRQAGARGSRTVCGEMERGSRRRRRRRRGGF
jgi:hypothetical protein